jgi:hypothetical protein
MKTASATAFACLLATAAILCSGCGSGGGTASAADHSKPCPSSWRTGWQHLANRVHAPVYCPRWIPSPLTGDIHGQWSTGVDVSPDRSYLVGFIWVEHSDEVHVNMRGYPGRSAIPKCLVEESAGKKAVRTSVPCFADPKWTKKIDGTKVTLYTVNRDADQWHLLLAWHRHGSLYAVSEHVAPPFGYARVVANLRHMFHSLVLVQPQS